jgi:hypothetical protein
MEGDQLRGGGEEERIAKKKMLNKALIHMLEILNLVTLIGSGISAVHHKCTNFIKCQQVPVRRPSFADHPRISPPVQGMSNPSITIIISAIVFQSTTCTRT